MDPDHPEAKKMVFKQLIVWDRSGYRSQRVLVSKRLSFTGMAENLNAKLSGYANPVSSQKAGCEPKTSRFQRPTVRSTAENIY